MLIDKLYSYDLFYNIHARYPHPSLFRLDDGTYYRAFDHNETLSLMYAKANKHDLTCVPLVGEMPLHATKRVLGTNSSQLAPFYDFAREHPPLWAVVEPLYGLPLYQTEHLYEALIYVIIEQHISWVNAQKAQQALVEWGDRYIEYDGHRHYVMPSPEQLANATIDDLRPLKITFKRMQLLIDLSQKFCDDPDFMILDDQLSAEDLYKRLLEIKGVGHWTASVVVARSKGVYRYVPHNDVALQSAVATYFNTDKSADATQAIFAQYGDFAGLAAHFTLMKWVLDKYPIVNGK